MRQVGDAPKAHAQGVAVGAVSAYAGPSNSATPRTPASAALHQSPTRTTGSTTSSPSVTTETPPILAEAPTEGSGAPPADPEMRYGYSIDAAAAGGDA